MKSFYEHNLLNQGTESQLNRGSIGLYKKSTDLSLSEEERQEAKATILEIYGAQTRKSERVEAKRATRKAKKLKISR